MTRLLTRRRVAWTVVLLVAFALVWSGWLVFRAQRDLRAAEQSLNRLAAAVSDGDVSARTTALADLRRQAASAHGVTGSLWWTAFTHVPMLGDDAHGVRALSAGLDDVASNGLGPLVATVDQLPRVSGGGGFDLGAVQGLQAPVAQASASFERAAADVESVDSSGFVEPLRQRYHDVEATLRQAASGLAAARTATDLVPALTGADGPRDYLVVLQNNAEIRSGGGIGGSWAHVHADGGLLTLEQQGGAGDLGPLDRPVLSLTSQEQAVYGDVLGRYFQDPSLTPDFPRAAQLWAALWSRAHPGTPLDGVISIDPVALSYLLRGTGPVPVRTVTLTSSNVVEAMLSTIYERLSPQAQNDAFQQVVKSVFKAVTGPLPSPYLLAQGLQRATDEGRFHLALFRPEDAALIAGTRVEGAMAGDDGSTPHVDVGLSDATGSKMSYYLRFGATLTADSCVDGRQQLTGSMALSQTISPVDASKLADYVTGGGHHGVAVGSQLVQVRVFGPWGGTITGVTVDGDTQPVQAQTIDGRPEATISVELRSTSPVELAWKTTSGTGQTGAARLHVTPGVVAPDPDVVVPSSCS